MKESNVQIFTALVIFFSILSPLSDLITDITDDTSVAGVSGLVGETSLSSTDKKTSMSETPLDFTHFVMGEFFTATWCGHCPPANEQLSDIYYNDSYQFYYVAMICDKNDKASDRMGDYPTATGYPTVEFDGGYRENTGEHSDKSSYEQDIEDCGARSDTAISLEVNMSHISGSTIHVRAMVRWDEDGTVINPTLQAHLRVYITEIDSRYIDADGDDYVFGFLDYAFDQEIDLNPHEWWTGETEWTGSEHQDEDGNDFGDIDYDNLAIIAAVFNNEQSDSDKYSLMCAGAIAPTLNITSPQNGTTVNGDFTLSARSHARHEEGDPTGIAKLEYAVDNGSFQNIPHESGDKYTVNVDTSNWEDGWHEIKVRSTDEKNTTNTETLYLKYSSEDTEPPDIENISPTEGSEIEGDVIISAEITDNSEFSASYRIDSGNWSSLTHDSGDTYIAEWDSREVLDGNHIITIRAVDEHSNSAERTVGVEVENLKLHIASPEDNATVRNMVQIRGEITSSAEIKDAKYQVDNGDWLNMSLDEDECTADWNSREVENGIHTLTVRVTDSIGNVEEKSVNVDVENEGEDTTPPVLSIETPSEGENISGVFELKAHATDENGIKSVEFQVDNGDWQRLKHDTGDLYTLDWNTRETSNGNHTLHFRAQDTSNNLAEKVVNVTVYNTEDTERPLVEAVFPVQDSLISVANGSLRVLAHAEDNSGIDRVECRLDDGIWRAMDYDDNASRDYGKAIYSFEYTTEDEFRYFADGTHSLTLRTIDNSNNERQISIQFHSDSTPPSFSMEMPAFASDTLSLTGQISDMSEIVKLQVFIDDSEVYSGSAEYYHFQLSIHTNTFSEGKHILRVIAKDLAGNTGEKIGSLTLDFTPPEIQIIEPTSYEVIGGLLEVKVVVQDINPHIIGLMIDEEPMLIDESGEEQKTFRIGTTMLEDGIHSLDAYSTDMAGNTAHALVIIKIDNTPPEIQEIQVAPTEPLEWEEISFNIYISDDNPLQEVILWYELCDGSTCLEAKEIEMEKQQGRYTATITTASGTITYSIIAIDVAGNEGISEERTLIVFSSENEDNQQEETSPPTGVLLTSLRSGQTVSGTILLSGAAYYARTVKISIDGVPYITIGTHRAYHREKMPDYTFVYSNNYTISISELRGIPVIIDIMSLRCSACEELAESLKVITNRYDNYVMVISIDGAKNENATMLNAYREEHDDYEWLFVMDTVGITEHFGVVSFPEVIFITPDGYISARFNGAMSVEEIEAQIGISVSEMFWNYYLDTTDLTNGNHTITIATGDGLEVNETITIQVYNEKKESSSGDSWLKQNTPIVGAGIIIAVAVGIGVVSMKRRQKIEYYCPVCGTSLRYIEEYDAWYCDECGEYPEELNEEG